MRFHLEDRLRSFARMITGNYRLKVIFTGTVASITTDLMHIPPLEDTPEAFSKAKFLVAHESGHDIHSIMDLKEKASKQSMLLGDILNSLEDARIERLMTERFEGLQTLFEQEIHKIIASNNYASIPLSVQVLHGLYLMGKGYSMAPLSHEAQKLIEGCDALVKKAIHAKSSHDVLKVAEEVYERIKHLEKKHVPQMPMVGGSGGSLPDMVMESLGKHMLDPDYDGMEDYPFLKDENTDEEETERLPHTHPLPDYLALIRQHRKHQSYLIQHLRSIIDTRRRQSRKRSFQVNSSGTVDIRHIWKLATGDDIVMKRRQRGMQQDIDPDSLAVYLLLDESHSMETAFRINYAKEAVAVLGEVLNELEIPFAITGYTTGPGLTRFLYKQFDEDYRMVRTRLVDARNRQGTYTQEQIPYAVRRLAARSERRKLLMVLTDAEDVESTVRFRRAVAIAQDEGVQLLGIGINTNFVQGYFHTFVELRNLEGFSEELLKLLKRVLKGAAAPP